MMRINHKILSIPPYISTTWEQVLSLKAEEHEQNLALHITLKDGSTVHIPTLENSTLDAIFSSHAKYLEQEPSSPFSFFVDLQENTPLLTEIPPPLPFSALRGFTSIFQHDPDKQQEEPLPKELTDKIALITKKIGINDLNTLPKAEPHCNCPYCQIARSMRNTLENTEDELSEEEVEDKELSFSSWIIQPIELNQYKVTHPDFQEESYTVSLNSPIGCTCGSTQCEHISAVLNS